MASWKKKLNIDTRYSITLEVEETSTSIEDNSSVVSYTLTATKSGGTGYYTSNKTNPVKVTINGSEVVNKKVVYDFTGSTPKTITLASGTESISHEADGTKTIQCSGYFKDAENSLGKATASGSLKLTDLHKAPEIIFDKNENIVENVSYITNTIGLDDDVFVKGLSIKTFTISATPYDNATITSFKIQQGDYSVTTTNITNNTGTITMNFQENTLVSSTTEGITGSYYRFTLTATDSMGGVATQTFSYGAMQNNSGTYDRPTITPTNTTARRDGQLTGKVNLSASGTYTYQVGTVSTYQTLTPTLTINVYEKGSSTLKFTRDITTSDSQFTYSSGSWTLANLPIGTERGTSDTPPSNWFDPGIAYNIVILVKDNVTNSVSTIDPTEYSTSVLIGEPIMRKYQDRVDFKRLTRQKGEVYGETELYYDETGTTSTITLTDDSFANYEYVEVFYYVVNSSCYLSQKIYSPNGKSIQLFGQNENGTYMYQYTAEYTFSGTTMTRNKEIRWRLSSSGSSNREAGTSQITIYRVVGYK